MEVKAYKLQDQKNLCKKKKVISVRAFHFFKESLHAIVNGQLIFRNAQRMVFIQMQILSVAESGTGFSFP